ncbi:MAG: HNH endonuclease [Betaproteobacteria bacterium]|nr:HNH endonuclease [Betaproteobacteria bacterium]
MPERIERYKPPRFVVPTPTKEHDHYNTADWKAKRIRIGTRDAFVCRDCGRVAYGKDGHADHIVPLEEGGTDDDENLAWRCASCHGRKTREEQRRRGILS